MMRSASLATMVALCSTAMVRGQMAGTEGGIWVGRWQNRAVAAGSVRRVSPSDGGTYLQPMMHLGGTHVVFWGRTAKDNAGRPLDAVRNLSDIFVVKVDGTNPHKLTNDLKTNKEPAWAPDGRIVFASGRGGEPGTRLWVMDSDGKNLRQLTNGPEPVGDSRSCVSPDGKWVVFCSNRGGGGEPKLWRVPLEGGQPEQVSRAAGAQARPMFSHDGKRLAYFTTGSPPKRFNLALMDWPDGKEVQPVDISKGNDNLRGPFWMRTGSHLLVHGRLNGELWLYMIEAATGTWRKVGVPGMLTCGHATLDREEKWITFDGARVVLGK